MHGYTQVSKPENATSIRRYLWTLEALEDPRMKPAEPEKENKPNKADVDHTHKQASAIIELSRI